MPVYGSDNVAALSNNTSVIVLDGSIQNSQQQASVGTDYFRISSILSNLEETQSVAGFCLKKVAWPSKVRQSTNKS
jgi:hypothetical protein